jgi:hypothetical protein
LNQIPQVSIKVLKDGDRAVAFFPWLPNKDDAFGLVGLKVTPKVVREEKQKHSASGLISDARRLFFAGCSREKQSRFR